MQNPRKVLDAIEMTLDSLTNVLLDNIDDSKEGTLRSITHITEDAIGKSLDGMKAMDPRGILRATGFLAKKSSDIMTGWKGDEVSTGAEDPLPAADVLG